MTRTIYFFKDYLVENFGVPLYRIPIDLPFGCPHRNEKGNGGCIFCDATGARARHLKEKTNIADQIAKGIEYTERRYNANGQYIAYFQSYTNTNAPVKILRKYYEEALSCAKFKMAIVSTRPDCLSEDVLEYLKELNTEYNLWVELGVQTTNDKTLQTINRGHTFEATQKAVLKLSALNIKTAAHIIIGLPGESITDFSNTISTLAALPFSGIKIHNLLILKNTQLAKLYAKNPKICRILNEYEYAKILIDILRRIPAHWPVMRLNADADPKNIIAPKWSISKGQFIQTVQNAMKENGYNQGDSLNKDISNDTGKNSIAAFLKIKTDDNSYTFYNPVFKQNFHTISGARSEAQKKFIEPAEIEKKIAEKPAIKILDVGFGLGYNAIAAINLNLHPKLKTKHHRIKITSLELNDVPLTLALDLYKKNSTEYKIINDLINSQKWTDNLNEIEIIFGDARNKYKIHKKNHLILFLWTVFRPIKIRNCGHTIS